jgi:hypothetical protein
MWWKPSIFHRPACDVKPFLLLSLWLLSYWLHQVASEPALSLVPHYLRCFEHSLCARYRDTVFHLHNKAVTLALLRFTFHRYKTWNSRYEKDLLRLLWQAGQLEFQAAWHRAWLESNPQFTQFCLPCKLYGKICICCCFIKMLSVFRPCRVIINTC